MKSIEIHTNKVIVSADVKDNQTKETMDLSGGSVIYSPIDSSIVSNQIVKEQISSNGRFEITFDRTQYTGIDTAVVEVAVPKEYFPPQVKSVIIDENGEYQIENDLGYNLSRVDISVNVDSSASYQEGFDDGFEAGEFEQKEKLTSIDIVANGEYNREDGYNHITVNVPGSLMPTQEKAVEYTYNGHFAVRPDTGYLLSKVDVSVNIDTDAYYENGYTHGKSDGIIEQKNKLDSSTFTENGTYTREDGFNSVTVAVDTSTYYNEGYNAGEIAGYNTGYSEGETIGYNEGFPAGQEAQKALLDSSTFIENGTYEREDGWNSVTVAVDTSTYYDQGYNTGYSEGESAGYDEGYPAGVAAQKALLDSSIFIENGIYTSENGWNSVTVDVPSSSFTTQSKVVDSSTVSQLVLPDSSFDALSDVTVNPYTLDSSTLVVYNNGSYTVHSAADGLEYVDVSVYVAAINGRLQAKTVDSSTSLQVITPTSPDYTGLAEVTINPYLLDEVTVDSSTSAIVVNPTRDGISKVTVNPYHLDSKTVDPSTSAIHVTSSLDGLSEVVVTPVNSSIDPQIIPENIKAGVNILGVTGTMTYDITVDLQDKTVIPSDSSIEVTADSQYDGLGTVNIAPAPLEELITDSSTNPMVFLPGQGNIGFSSVTVNPYTLESVVVDSSTELQVIHPAQNYDALSVVAVNPYTTQFKTVDASSGYLTIYADSSYDALSGIRINAVTSAIDPYIQPGNIANGVTILGVTGTLATSDNLGFEEIYNRLRVI